MILMLLLLLADPQQAKIVSVKVGEPIKATIAKGFDEYKSGPPKQALIVVLDTEKERLTVQTEYFTKDQIPEAGAVVKYISGRWGFTLLDERGKKPTKLRMSIVERSPLPAA